MISIHKTDYHSDVYNFIIGQEGNVGRPYFDTATIPRATIGYGFNIEWRDTPYLLPHKIGVREQFSLMNKSIWLSHSNSLEYAPRTQGGGRGA